MTEDQEEFEVGGWNEFKLLEPYDVIVAAHHGAVRLRLEYRANETKLPANTFYGCEMTPEEARAMAAHLVREAQLAERDGH